MSRGIGKTQREILEAMACNPEKNWSRMSLQQEVWGRQKGSRPDLLKRYPQGERPYKNVNWWSPDDKQRFESNFTRTLLSLENKNLVICKRSEGGHMRVIRLTSDGYKTVKGVDLYP